MCSHLFLWRKLSHNQRPDFQYSSPVTLFFIIVSSQPIEDPDSFYFAISSILTRWLSFIQSFCSSVCWTLSLVQVVKIALISHALSISFWAKAILKWLSIFTKTLRFKDLYFYLLSRCLFLEYIQYHFYESHFKFASSTHLNIIFFLISRSFVPPRSP